MKHIRYLNRQNLPLDDFINFCIGLFTSKHGDGSKPEVIYVSPSANPKPIDKIVFERDEQMPSNSIGIKVE